MEDLLSLILMDKKTEEKLKDGRIKILSPLEFHFQTSDRKDESYLVDLSYYKGSGACWCEHFRFRIEPKIKSGEILPHEEGSQCKHIIAARLILGDKVIQSSMERLSG